MRVWWLVMMMVEAVIAVGVKEMQIYNEINSLRRNPVRYAEQNGYHLACSVPVAENYSVLSPIPQLEQSSYFQASTMSSAACGPVSHNTCPQYCNQFGGDCSHVARMQSFLHGQPAHEMTEILIMGPKNITKIMGYFIASEGHCNHLLDCHINSMGASFQHTDRNIMVVDFCYLEQVI